MAVHELAGPAAAASLSLETALMLAERGDLPQAVCKLRSAATHVEALQDLLLAMSTSGVTVPPADAANLRDILQELFPGGDYAVAAEIPTSLALTRAALRSMVRTLGAGGPVPPVRVEMSDAELALKISGPGRPGPLLRFWTSRLRTVGVRATSRRRASTTFVVLRWPRNLRCERHRSA